MSETSVQNLGYPAGFDYDVGSPHLRHAQLRRWIVDVLADVVSARLAARGAVRVLEIGAGHGSFTDHVLAIGADVTVTETSAASAELLDKRYAHNPRARVMFDPDGSGAAVADERFDAVVCISVLHHIPDYLAAIDGWVRLLDPGGAFVSFQDPLWYPRRSRASMATSRAAFMAWRASQPGRSQALRSLIRRRSHLDEQNPRDMVEYHVLRSGCDEEAIVEQLRGHFDRVQLHRYWSTQARTLQTLGARLRLESEFGIVALGRA